MVHYTVTVSAAAQSIAQALGLTAAQDIPLAEVQVQAGKANTADTFIGGAGVTTTDYGIRVDPGDTAPPIPLLQGCGIATVKPSTVYFIGTAGHLLHFSGVPL
jgi:hypothetical protein